MDNRAACKGDIAYQVDLLCRDELAQRKQYQDTLRKLYQAQLVIQKTLECVALRPNDPQLQAVNTPQSPPQQQYTGGQPMRPPGSCFRCGKLGHFVRDCCQNRPRRWGAQRRQSENQGRQQHQGSQDDKPSERSYSQGHCE